MNSFSSNPGTKEVSDDSTRIAIIENTEPDSALVQPLVTGDNWYQVNMGSVVYLDHYKKGSSKYGLVLRNSQKNIIHYRRPHSKRVRWGPGKIFTKRVQIAGVWVNLSDEALAPAHGREIK